MSGSRATSDCPARVAQLRTHVTSKAHTLSLQHVLRDHANVAHSICSRADSALEPLDQGTTIASLIMDPEDQTMWLADGLPCAVDYRGLDYSDWFARAMRSRAH
jgi:hypothetical protein